MKIETPLKEIKATNNTLFDFLTDMNNYDQLLPPEKVEDFSATKDTCEFKIKGLSNVGMKIQNVVPNESIHIVSHGKVPFDFELKIQIDKVADEVSSAQAIFDGKINAFMKMMVEKPLTNFFSGMVNQLAKIHNS